MKLKLPYPLEFQFLSIPFLVYLFWEVDTVSSALTIILQKILLFGSTIDWPSD